MSKTITIHSSCDLSDVPLLDATVVHNSNKGLNQLAEVEMLRHGQEFIGLFESNLGRLVYSLRYPQIIHSHSLASEEKITDPSSQNVDNHINDLKIFDQRVPICDFSPGGNPKPKCIHNDSLCGVWHNRSWHPLSCAYRKISAQDARKCLGNRTLAFIGDSMVRDFGTGVAHFLSGMSTQTASDEKNDKAGVKTLPGRGFHIGLIDMWSPFNVKQDENFNGFVFPTPALKKSEPSSYSWQVQIWEMYSRGKGDKIGPGRSTTLIDDVLNNRLAGDPNKYINGSLPLTAIDLAFMNIGIHDFGYVESVASSQ